MLLVLAVILAFLLGSFPSGYLIGKYFYGIDVREHGSCNLGATNVMRLLGTAPGIVCLILDILKGFVAVWLFTRLFSFNSPSMYPQLLIALGVVSGHCFCPWLGWRGGKGVATALGALMAIAPVQIACVALIGVILIAATGYVSIGSIVGAFLFPIFVYFSTLPSSMFYVTIVLGCILILRHTKNIERLFLGTEKHFWKSSTETSDDAQATEPTAEGEDQPAPADANAESADAEPATADAEPVSVDAEPVAVDIEPVKADADIVEAEDVKPADDSEENH